MNCKTCEHWKNHEQVHSSEGWRVCHSIIDFREDNQEGSSKKAYLEKGVILGKNSVLHTREDFGCDEYREAK